MIKRTFILFFALFSISCSKGWLLKMSGNYTTEVIIQNDSGDTQDLIVRESNQSGEIVLEITLLEDELYVWEEVENGNYFFDNINGQEIINLNDWVCYVYISSYSGAYLEDCCQSVGHYDCDVY